MKKTSNVKGKVLFSSSAAILLGLISINPHLVKADSFSTSQMASKKETTATETPNPSEDIISEPANTDESAANQASPTTQDSDATVNKKRIDGTAAGLQVSYDLDTDELIILGGTYEQISFLDDCLSDYSLSDDEGNSIKLARAKQIAITGKISLNSSNCADFLFAGFSNTSKIVGLEHLDLSQATSTIYMFNGCENLTSLNLSSFNTANVTEMRAMFRKCRALTALDLSSFNISKVTDMSCMFADDENLVDLNISSFKTTLPVDLGATFKNCASLVELNLENFCIPDTNLGEVELEDTFYGCTSLRKLNIKNIAIGDNEYENMLAKLPSLNTLVLGKYTGLSTVFPSGAPAEDVGLDTEGIWLNVGNGTAIRPEGTEQYTSEQLMAARATIRGSNQRNFTKAETYVRMGLPITIHHVDESGKQIAEDTIFPGNFGDPYSIIGDPVAGYTLKDGQAPVTGIYDNDENKEREFTFTYIKNPESSTPIKGEDVIVHYQDEQGRTIAPNEVLNGNTGDGYVSAAKEIAGYTLKTRPKNATGFFSDITQNVTYVYSKTDSNAEGQTDDKDNGNKSNGNKGNKANSATPSRLSPYDAHKNALGNDADSLHSANSSTNNQLPKTGSEKKAQLATIALGLITLTNALALLWAKIKKFSK
ncbi:BspA family leucine-rich repeat surface protein [Lactobacillus sp. ESL0263]|uniref:MucBP domain-containing protein n=1 Tax=Lactobacillus sp. ESL0263 TaxID=2069350 RepID=UPI000EFB5F19|nr:MucBP domain-containing protein [Lactobacillus sp. ESL0263]RMC48546.1 BspA family leucine-rich repeat surface protein [Lactobacillus sp. ESL0263]